MKTTIIAAVVLAIGAVAVAQEKVTLKAKREPGAYVMTMTSDGATNVTGARNVKQKTSTLIAMEMTADKPTAEGQVIHVTYKRFKLNVSNPMMSVTYDSANPASAESPLAPTYKAMLDKTVDVTLAADGAVKDVEGVDQLFDEVTRDNPQMAQAAAQMKQQFGKGMFVQMFESTSKSLPAKPVGPGDTWTVNEKMTMPTAGMGNIKIDYKLKEIKDGIAYIDFTGKITRDEAATGPASGLPIKIDQFKSTQSGTMKFDIAKGMATQTKMDQKTSVATTRGEGESAQKENIDIDQTMLVTLAPGKYTPPASQPAPAPAQK